MKILLAALVLATQAQAYTAKSESPEWAARMVAAIPCEKRFQKIEEHNKENFEIMPRYIEQVRRGERRDSLRPVDLEKQTQAFVEVNRDFARAYLAIPQCVKGSTQEQLDFILKVAD